MHCNFVNIIDVIQFWPNAVESRCGAHSAAESVMSLPHGDVLCDSLRKRCTAKWNLFLLRSKGQNNMHTNVRLWIKATCGPSAKLTDLLMSNRVSSMMLMVKLESWGYSHKSRNAWASCFWLTRTPVRCIFSFHAPSSTGWECVTMKCNYVKTSNDELMFTPYSVSQIPMQVHASMVRVVPMWSSAALMFVWNNPTSTGYVLSMSTFLQWRPYNWSI